MEGNKKDTTMDAIDSSSAANSGRGAKLASDNNREEEKKRDDRAFDVGDPGGENDGVEGNSNAPPNDDESSQASHEEDDDADTSESESDAEDPMVTTSDGRVLSAYELQREERIRRNKEYLQSLGLERPIGDSEQPRQQRRSKSKPALEKQRSSLRAKREVDYSEPKTSIASIIRDTASDKKKKRIPKKENKKKEPAKEKKESMRMERFVYREFQSLQAHKNQVLRQAERLHGAARREVKYWSKLVEKAETREKRREEASQNVEHGLSVRALLREVDNRTSELVDAVGRYDEELQEREKAHEQEKRRLDADNKLKTLNALERFPKALRENVSLLDSVLLERSPLDPPPPRRSHRSAQEEVALDDQIPSGASQPSRLKEEEGLVDVKDDWGMMSSAFLVSSELDKLSRTPQNVGGWVSPAFADQIDRSWLNRDAPPNPFDPSTFVPQIGDCVLYYPVGHKNHLRHFPDVLGKQTGVSSRVPLWERTHTVDAEPNENNAEGWHSVEWASSMESDEWNYPILCRVERTSAEFPPDPYVKVVDEDGDGEVVRWEPPKGTAALKRIPGTPLGLAVDLRPLTSLIPPSGLKSGSMRLLPPPVFTVATFPTELDPFLIPFAWAYASHSLQIGGSVKHKDDDEGSILRIEEFGTLAGSASSCRLEHHRDTITTILSQFREGSSKLDILSRLLSDAPREFPIREGRLLIDVLRRVATEMQASIVESVRRPDEPGPLGLFGLIQETLPLWNSVAVIKVANKRKQHWVSPWLLVPSDRHWVCQDFSPEKLASASNAFDESLCTKISLMLDEVWARFDDSDDFYYDISDDDAPSYGCAVPVMMSFEKIMRRLRKDGRSSCYYRSADEVIADAGMIWKNCLLYNSPDSPVVESAAQIVTELRFAVSRTVVSHVEGHREAMCTSESRRRLIGCVTHSFEDSSSHQAQFALPPVLSTIRSPYRDQIEQEWLHQVSPTVPSTPSSPALGAHEQQKVPQWYPQAGDRVLYSPENHEMFIKHHAASLQPEQCILPSVPAHCWLPRRTDQENMSSSSCRWTPCAVLWVRAQFPAPKAKRGGSEFSTVSSLLAVGVQFQSHSQTSVIYWRPCLLEADRVEGKSACSICGLNVESSFLQWLPTEPNCDMSEPFVSSLARCLNLLKRRCIKREQVSSLDEGLTAESVMDGYSAPAARLGAKSVPSYAGLLLPQRMPNALGTRGVGLTHEPDPALPNLAKSGFLPRWISNSPDATAERLDRHRMVSPWPKLSLELIVLRIKAGYYRHKSAIENDIAEAYVNQAAFLISDSAGRRKSPASMRRISQYLSTVPELSVGVDHRHYVEVMPTDEEISCSEQIRGIRELHAMSLVAVNETSHFEQLLGLVDSRPSVAALSGPAMDPARARAREKVETLLAAVAKDLVHKSSRAVTTKIVVRCGGESVHFPRYFSTISRAEALIDEKCVSVKFTRGGKVITAKQDVTEYLGAGDSSDPDSTSCPPTVSLPRYLSKVKVVCNGVSIASEKRHLLALVPGQLGEKGLTRVVETSIRCNRAECDESNTLVRFLVGQPGRMNRCARCEAYHRSFYCCRVVRGHLNEDFDWTSVFGDGVSGVDDLLQTLHQTMGPSSRTPEPNLTSKTASAQGGEQGVIEQRQTSRRGVPVPVASGSGGQQQTAQEPPMNLQANLERAKAALSLSSGLMNEAKEYNDAPARLSQEFISVTFPVDPTDGHYTYCVVCGLSGDLLCCDGCKNVVHQNCVNLVEVPDGDWFCDECVYNRSSTDGVNGVYLHASLPFGRVLFDESKPEKLSEMLASLSDARPYQRAVRSENHEGTVNDGNSGEIQDSMERRHGRPRKRPYEEVAARRESNNDSLSSPKKRRGRPRKHFSDGDLDEPADNSASESGLDEGGDLTASHKTKREVHRPPSKRATDLFLNGSAIIEIERCERDLSGI